MDVVYIDVVYILFVLVGIWLVTGVEQEMTRRQRIKLYKKTSGSCLYNPGSGGRMVCSPEENCHDLEG